MSAAVCAYTARRQSFAELSGACALRLSLSQDGRSSATPHACVLGRRERLTALAASVLFLSGALPQAWAPG
ncbi:hypothetical protein CIW48_03065 [Methylobacterium sp. P1-11]|nr:hypothetical protein CIW48_03065 [Methylobacterium sp. P1-11]